jgi:SAM-dependent methyltransferase
MNLMYLGPRLARHFLPERLTRFLLLRSLIIKPGLETQDPLAAVGRYRDLLDAYGESIAGKRVLVFGYGGRFDIGIGLLAAGAAHVSLCDRYAPPDDRHNETLLSAYGEYIVLGANGPRPRWQRMDLLEGDIRGMDVPEGAQSYDLIISNSVYEHVEDAAGITQALARWSAPTSIHVHFVDLRDHFFKYPLEMLRYSESTWRRWLNPTSNHNRLRLWDYRRIFETCFESVDIEVLDRDQAALEKIRRHIRPEFLSGNEIEDAATLIRITARRPRG